MRRCCLRTRRRLRRNLWWGLMAPIPGSNHFWREPQFSGLMGVMGRLGEAGNE